LNGFWKQDLNNNNATWQSEAYNGKVYNTYVLQTFLLYPQQSGVLTIDPFSVQAITQVVIKNATRQSPLDLFYGMSDVVQEIPKELSTNPVKIKVLEFPEGAPASFQGAVGKFDIEAEMPSEQINANSSAYYVVNIQGNGNLQFLQAPKLELPTSFELYEVKTTESLRSGHSGVSGYRRFEYPFIARAEG
jgi:hypothetical protein